MKLNSVWNRPASLCGPTSSPPSSSSQQSPSPSSSASQKWACLLVTLIIAQVAFWLPAPLWQLRISKPLLVAWLALFTLAIPAAVFVFPYLQAPPTPSNSYLLFVPAAKCIVRKSELTWTTTFPIGSASRADCLVDALRIGSSTLIKAIPAYCQIDDRFVPVNSQEATAAAELLSKLVINKQTDCWIPLADSSLSPRALLVAPYQWPWYAWVLLVAFALTALAVPLLLGASVKDVADQADQVRFDRTCRKPTARDRWMKEHSIEEPKKKEDVEKQEEDEDVEDGLSHLRTRLQRSDSAVAWAKLFSGGIAIESGKVAVEPDRSNETHHLASKAPLIAVEKIQHNTPPKEEKKEMDQLDVRDQASAYASYANAVAMEKGTSGQYASGDNRAPSPAIQTANTPTSILSDVPSGSWQIPSEKPSQLESVMLALDAAEGLAKSVERAGSKATRARIALFRAAVENAEKAALEIASQTDGPPLDASAFGRMAALWTLVEEAEQKLAPEPQQLTRVRSQLDRTDSEGQLAHELEQLADSIAHEDGEDDVDLNAELDALASGFGFK